MERIFGYDHELGMVINSREIKDELLTEYLSLILPGNTLNGGNIDSDLGHPEIRTPETKTIRERVIYELALEEECFNILGKNKEHNLYKNTIDNYNSSFGAHESYEMKVHPTETHPLLLFEVVQKIFTGAGYINASSKKFEISQRARSILNPISENTTEKRGILNIRNEPLRAYKEYPYRLHHISNDAHRCPENIWLKVGSMHLILALLENNLLPCILYDYSKSVSDLRKISLQTSDWTLEGTDLENKSALKVLREYYDTAKEEFKGESSETDYTLYLWDYCLSNLENINNKPYALKGTLDWVTRKWIIDMRMTNDGLPIESPEIQSLSLDYDLIGPEGIFSYLQEENIISDAGIKRKDIEYALVNPPKTRALCRGEITRRFSQNLNGKAEINMVWDSCSVSMHKERRNILWQAGLPDPYKTYPKIVEELGLFLRKNCFLLKDC